LRPPVGFVIVPHIGYTAWPSMSRFTSKPAIGLDELRHILHYEPTTGIFRWRNPVSSQVCIGGIAGGKNKARGYWQITIRGKNYEAHRLAWFYVHGVWSSFWNRIDHKNQNKMDNRLCNLRLVTPSQNNLNRKISGIVGFRGLRYSANGRRYVASISVNNKSIYLGTFDGLTEGCEAYLSAVKRYFGEDFADTC
jgi:hypothetical protein